MLQYIVSQTVRHDLGAEKRKKKTMNNKVIEIKYALEGTNSRISVAEEPISEPEDRRM